jgi:hypothetical protein
MRILLKKWQGDFIEVGGNTMFHTEQDDVGEVLIFREPRDVLDEKSDCLIGKLIDNGYTPTFRASYTLRLKNVLTLQDLSLLIVYLLSYIGGGMHIECDNCYIKIEYE